MAEVREGDREKTGMAGGKFPVATHAQALSAIKLRHNGKGVSASAVLAHVMAAATKHGWDDIKAKVREARQADKGGKD